ncbi:MAG TPA: 4-hydroxy-tetrahydrodipicolinate reductase, partial [Solirubrobacterales bacterium]|nr:4-hydroxy-tetrahydrodipicolinate reductase [Solirubrobacterales bacterium]
MSGAAGRMGATVCEAVRAADGMELTGRADPALETGLEEILEECDVIVEFSTPETALA